MVATRSGRAAPADGQPQEHPDEDTFLDDLAKEMLKEITAEAPVETETAAAENNVDSVQLSAFRWKPETRLPTLSKDAELALKRDPNESMAKKVGRAFDNVEREDKQVMDIATDWGNTRPLSFQLTLPPLTGKRSIRAARESIPDTSGKKWYNMPAPQITEEVKRDLRILRLRQGIDGGKHSCAHMLLQVAFLRTR